MDLQHQIQELLHTSIRAFDIKEHDAVSLKTLKLILVGQVLEGLGLSWTALIGLFKTHTPIHPQIADELRDPQIADEMRDHKDEEYANYVAQIFVRNEKLVRMMKSLHQHGKHVEALLAVDGLGGNNIPNFEHRHYVQNLKFGRFGVAKSAFDNEPEYKRLHVQTIRELYDKLENVSAPEKHIYQILKCCFQEMVGITLPNIEMKEVMNPKLQKECCQYYVDTMGKEHVENVVKSLKRFRGEKRTLEREDEPLGSNEK